MINLCIFEPHKIFTLGFPLSLSMLYSILFLVLSYITLLAQFGGLREIFTGEIHRLNSAQVRDISNNSRQAWAEQSRVQDLKSARAACIFIV